MSYHWKTPVRYIKGIGPTKAGELTKTGIETVGDLLERHPLSYIYPGAVSIADAKEGDVVIKATIDRIFRAGHGAIAVLSDETGTCKAQWFHNPWVLSFLRSGMVTTFWGKYKGGVLVQPKWSTCEASMRDVYGGQYGVHHATIRAALKEVLAHVELPPLFALGMEHRRAEVFESFHFPNNKTEQRSALHAIKFDEALCLQLALAERRRGKRQQTIRSMDWYADINDTPIKVYFPYDFTNDQGEAITDIVLDMTGTRGRQGICSPMQRLIHGEVGSGKTAVAFYAAMLAALNDKRTLILCPTTILAQQHYDTLKGMGWEDVGLHNGPTPSQHTLCANIVIGTHALLNQEDVIKSTSLVIIDEFQKFGVEQRAKLQKNNPHLLLLSATPIPRTLASTVFGDLDVSVIRELPIKRGTVVTKWVLPDRREGVYEIIEQELAAGHQAYVVYPRIDGTEQDRSARKGNEELQERFPDYVVCPLTGKDPAWYKTEMLKNFREGYVHVLTSTIIAEVGLDNSNANIMVIEGADRFGLSQLHQLRGRVCRSTDTAFCFLVSETGNPTSIARLEAIEKCNDGFEIAEEDLRLRGPGEVFSTRQHGLPDLKWISLVDDYDLMIEAKELVQAGSVGDGPKQMMEIKYDLQLGEVT